MRQHGFLYFPCPKTGSVMEVSDYEVKQAQNGDSQCIVIKYGDTSLVYVLGDNIFASRDEAYRKATEYLDNLIKQARKNASSSCDNISRMRDELARIEARIYSENNEMCQHMREIETYQNIRNRYEKIINK